MENKHFNFQKDDMSRLLKDKWPNVKTFHDLGLTQKEYDSCPKIEELFISRNYYLEDDVFFMYGYCDTDDFKEVYIKYLFLNAIVHTPHTSLKQYLDSFYNKAKVLTKKNVPRIPTDEGNLIDYLMRYDLSVILQYYW